MSRSTAVERLCAERVRFLETIESLTDDEFDHAPTLCAGWAPRDVLAHLIGTDHLPSWYLRPSTLTINRGNARMVRQGRALTRAELTRRGWHSARNPTRSARAIASLLLGDAAMHHQDVLRGLGRQRALPPDVARALFREGRIWSWAFGAKLLRHRVEPTTPGGVPCGRGVRVTGTTEALALWLAGRPGLEPELQFAPADNVSDTGRPGRRPGAPTDAK